MQRLLWYIFFTMRWKTHRCTKSSMTQREKCIALLQPSPSRLSAVCVHAVTTASHNRGEGRDALQIQLLLWRSMPEFNSSPRSTLSFSQCVCWLGEAAIQWPLPCWGGETPRVNPGLAGADRGQTQTSSQHARGDKSAASFFEPEELKAGSQPQIQTIGVCSSFWNVIQ